MIKRTRSMKFRIFLVSIVGMTLSTTLSFIIMRNVGQHFIEDDFIASQQSIATTLQNIKEETDLSLEKTAILVDNPLYEFLYFSESEAKQLLSDELSSLELNKKGISDLTKLLESDEDGFVTVTSKKSLLPLTVVKENQEYLMIYIDEANMINAFIRRPIGVSLLIATFIGFVLMTIGARQLGKPIQRLSNGLEEVAKGRFDTQLPVYGHDEVSAISVQFNKMVKELRAIVYLRRDFMNNICHELKTPLASIQGFAKLLQLDDLTEKQRYEYTQIISEEAERLSTLTVNILNLSKLENQLILEDVETFNLAEEIRKVFLLLEPLWSKKDLQFELALDEVEIVGCKELLIQVMLNLLSNAIKFSEDQGELFVSLEKKNQTVQLLIKDHGKGMSEETKNRLFEAFYQGEVAHNEEGHGLGLSIVKRIVTLHQGTISVDSELGTGTSVIIELPLEQ